MVMNEKGSFGSQCVKWMMVETKMGGDNVCSIDEGSTSSFGDFDKNKAVGGLSVAKWRKWAHKCVAIRVSKFKVSDWRLLGFLIEKEKKIGLRDLS